MLCVLEGEGSGTTREIGHGCIEVVDAKGREEVEAHEASILVEVCVGQYGNTCHPVLVVGVAWWCNGCHAILASTTAVHKGGSCRVYTVEWYGGSKRSQ